MIEHDLSEFAGEHLGTWTRIPAMIAEKISAYETAVRRFKFSSDEEHDPEADDYQTNLAQIEALEELADDLDAMVKEFQDIGEAVHERIAALEDSDRSR